MILEQVGHDESRVALAFFARFFLSSLAPLYPTLDALVFIGILKNKQTKMPSGIFVSSFLKRDEDFFVFRRVCGKAPFLLNFKSGGALRSMANRGGAMSKYATRLSGCPTLGQELSRHLLFFQKGGGDYHSDPC
jgi:hypothetical protein